MALEKVSFRLTGTRPLLMHNGVMADPTNPMVKEIKPIAKKRDKTEEDYEELRKLEWIAGLYLDENGRISLPEDMILGVIIEGARKVKKGKLAESGVLGASPYFPLEYRGPRDKLDLYNSGAFCDYRGVVVGQSRTMRARPRFNLWSVCVELLVETSTMNVSDLKTALEDGGRVIGIGDFRPRFGRFTVERVA